MTAPRNLLGGHFPGFPITLPELYGHENILNSCIIGQKHQTYVRVGSIELSDFVNTTQKELAALQKENEELKRMFLELYYAPGNPGYLKARQSFESQKKT